MIGGWGLALGFSVVNLVLPVLAFGPVSRYVSHIGFVLKGVGVLAVLGWVAAALVLNLGLAHFRDASADLSENIGAEALSRFQASPLGLHDAESWLLFVLGFFFSGVAFFEGRKLFGDSYPGYSPKHRKMETARADYDDHRVHEAPRSFWVSGWSSSRASRCLLRGPRAAIPRPDARRRGPRP